MKETDRPALWGKAIQLLAVPCFPRKLLRMASSSGDHGPLLTLVLSQHGALPILTDISSTRTNKLNTKEDSKEQSLFS